MPTKQAIAVFALLAGCAAASAQQTSQVELKIEATNRMLAASAEERVTADPEIAILHIGFETQPSDAKTAYAVGARTSNNIVSALKQAGIPETSIRSEWQQLESASGRPLKFNLIQEWTVKTPSERAAEILDVAVSAGATDSGQIDWTVKDEKALEEQALDQASASAKTDAAALAKGVGVRLGALIYVTNQVSTPQFSMAYDNNAVEERSRTPQALSIEPRKVGRLARVYAVFAIE
jgi:uncharacterized protein YggE